MTILGVDPHPGSHTAVALGQRLGALTFENTEGAVSKLVIWL